jgi:hypothetical protein
VARLHGVVAVLCVAALSTGACDDSDARDPVIPRAAAASRATPLAALPDVGVPDAGNVDSVRFGAATYVVDLRSSAET